MTCACHAPLDYTGVMPEQNIWLFLCTYITSLIAIFVNTWKWGRETTTKASATTYLGPVGHVPARLTGRPLTLLLRGRSVVRQTVVVTHDRQNRTKFLHTDDVSLDHTVPARHRTLHTASPTRTHYSHRTLHWILLYIKVKGKGICIAPNREKLTSEALRYGSHSFYTANTPYLPSSRKRSPDGATTE